MKKILSSAIVSLFFSLGAAYAEAPAKAAPAEKDYKMFPQCKPLTGDEKTACCQKVAAVRKCEDLKEAKMKAECTKNRKEICSL